MDLIKRTPVYFLAFAAFFALNAFTLKHVEEAQIKTSAVCGMCENTIKKAILQMDGVKAASLNTENGILTVKYDPHKVKLEDIRIAITKVGYDADDLEAETSAYENLHNCCKKDAVH
ncbi:MAG: heavy-metal-associated domain-containing protein [Chitinophagales bacterium]